MVGTVAQNDVYMYTESTGTVVKKETYTGILI